MKYNIIIENTGCNLKGKCTNEKRTCAGIMAALKNPKLLNQILDYREVVRNPNGSMWEVNPVYWANIIRADEYLSKLPTEAFTNPDSLSNIFRDTHVLATGGNCELLEYRGTSGYYDDILPGVERTGSIDINTSKERALKKDIVEKSKDYGCEIQPGYENVIALVDDITHPTSQYNTLVKRDFNIELPPKHNQREKADFKRFHAILAQLMAKSLELFYGTEEGEKDRYLGDFVRFASINHRFSGVNLSIIMRIHNHILKREGRNPMPAGNVDYFALCFPQGCFRNYYESYYATNNFESLTPTSVLTCEKLN